MALFCGVSGGRFGFGFGFADVVVDVVVAASGGCFIIAIAMVASLLFAVGFGIIDGLLGAVGKISEVLLEALDMAIPWGGP